MAKRDQLVESGVPFKVDKEAMKRKTKENKKKIWKHRAGLLWNHLVVEQPGMWGAIIAVSYATSFTTWYYRNHVGLQVSTMDKVGTAACWSVSSHRASTALSSPQTFLRSERLPHHNLRANRFRRCLIV